MKKFTLNNFFRQRSQSYYFFKTSIASSLFAISIFISLVYLGIWQMQRGQEKKLFLLNMEIRNEKVAKSLQEFLDYPYEKIKFYKTFIEGVPLQSHFLLDNQILKENNISKKANRVFSVIKINKFNKYILIDRGLLTVPINVDNLKKIYLPKKNIIWEGKIYNITKGLLLNKNKNLNLINNSIMSIQKIDYDLISKKLNIDLLPFFIRLEQNSSFVFEQTDIKIPCPPEKHFAYAVQWFALAGVVGVYYLLLSVKREEQGNEKKLSTSMDITNNIY